jgi:hypothetical protein
VWLLNMLNNEKWQTFFFLLIFRGDLDIRDSIIVGPIGKHMVNKSFLSVLTLAVLIRIMV